jgi:hypothetical protein
MLQVFYMDVAKVYQDIAYVAVTIHVYCKRMLQMFYLFFRRMLQACLSGCCICFTYILQMFYLHVAYVLQWLLGAFKGLFSCFVIFFTSVNDFHL